MLEAFQRKQRQKLPKLFVIKRNLNFNLNSWNHCCLYVSQEAHEKLNNKLSIITKKLLLQFDSTVSHENLQLHRHSSCVRDSIFIDRHPQHVHCVGSLESCECPTNYDNDKKARNVIFLISKTFKKTLIKFSRNPNARDFHNRMHSHSPKSNFSNKPMLTLRVSKKSNEILLLFL